jgi:hypothetical protein
LERHQLAELHNICPIENLPSILDRGLLSHRRASKLAHRSVAMAQIQDRRKGKQVPGGRYLHEYVNLYMNGRNVMMSKVLYSAALDEICLLRVSTAVLDQPGVVISDQNAASDYVRFAPSPGGLEHLRYDYLFARSWKYPDDQIEEWRHKSAMCAEVLVPDSVDPGLIMGAYVGSDSGRQAARQVAPSLPLVVEADKFLR